MQTHQRTVEPHRPIHDKSTLRSTSSPPFLEFLYPPRTLSFARCYHRNPGTIPSFRRRRKLSVRGYTSSTGPDQTQSLEEPSNPEPDQTVGEESAHTLNEDKLVAVRTLKEVLEGRNPADCEEAWGLFLREGRPKDYTQSLLLFLSSSDRPADIERSVSLFDSIDLHSRNRKDYWCAVKTAFRNDLPAEDVMELCKDAISRKKGELSWGLAIAIFVNRQDWDQALKLWKNRPYSTNKDTVIPLRSAELSALDALLDRLADLVDAIKTDKLSLSTPGISGLAKFMTYHVVSSRRIMNQTPLETILEMFYELVSLKLCAPDHYLSSLGTLLSTDARQATIRSILIYRNFRFRFPNEIPPRWILRRMLSRLSGYRITENIEYLLDEFRAFKEIPDIESYQFALTTFARQGDVWKTEELFKRLVEDHGTPDSQKSISPLVYAHARRGDVVGAKRRLDELMFEFSMKPNVVCWNIILAAHSRSSDLYGAMSTFQKMQDSGIEPDTHSYGTMMGMYAKRGDANAVKKLFYTAQVARVEMKATMIDTVVEVLCNNSKYEEAERVACEALDITPAIPLTRSWNILLWNHAFMSDVDSVSRLQKQMQDYDIAFDGMTYAALMLSLVLIRDTDAARKILKRLHRSGRIHITEFHYNILLHGYFREKNRDMVHILYDEMIERFGDPGPGSNLAKLRTLIQRDVWRYNERKDKEYGPPIDLTHSERFLESVMEDFNITNYGGDGPQLGTRRRTLLEAFPSAYYEFVIAAYGARGAFQRANELFDEFIQQGKQLSNPQSPPLQMLFVIMANNRRAEKHDWVDKCWDQALQRVLDLSKPIDLDSILHPYKTATEEPPQEDKSDKPPQEDEPIQVLPLHRFSLGQCLSTYIESLASRGLWSTIRDVVKEVEGYGFVLTTQNWGLYVRVLCQSPQPPQQLLAFTIFEDKFVDNFPGWKYLKLGFLKRPEGAPAGLDLLDRDLPRGKHPDMIAKQARRAWRTIKPDYMQPTYTTMMHLAAALIDFRMRSIVDGGKEMDNLLDQAPKTVKALITLPYFREKTQGILLRGRTDEPILDRPREIKTDKHVVWTGGLLGAEGEERIDTRPVEMVHDDDEATEEAESQEESDEDLEDSDSEWDQRPDRSSEPDSETLAALLEEDAHGRRWAKKPTGTDEDISSGLSLPAEDEQDLQLASRLAAREYEARLAAREDEAASRLAAEENEATNSLAAGENEATSSIDVGENEATSSIDVGENEATSSPAAGENDEHEE